MEHLDWQEVIRNVGLPMTVIIAGAWVFGKFVAEYFKQQQARDIERENRAATQFSKHDDWVKGVLLSKLDQNTMALTECVQTNRETQSLCRAVSALIEKRAHEFHNGAK